LRFGPVAQDAVYGFPREDLSLASNRRPNVDDQGSAVIEPYELVTLGISCESCHFGAREHALEGKRISFLPTSADLTFAKATPALRDHARQSPYVINAICAQCHDAKTQGPMYPNGGASWNSREAGDLAAGACAEKIKCTDCHDPHQAGPVPGANHPQQGGACVRCHETLAEPRAAATHSQHGDDVTCLDCHMPRMVHGLSDMIRSHRISSPTDRAMLEGDWPNACNLCHLDRSLRWTLDALKARWRPSIAPPADRAATDRPLGEVWLAHPEAVVRQVAADAYSRSPLGKGALERVLPILDDPSPPNRMFGRVAVERILGRTLSLETYRPWASPSERRGQIEALARPSGQQP
jgi:predicted CXXCH cytochrome family protein